MVVKNMFLASILKLFNSLYLSHAFHLKVSCINVSLLVLTTSFTAFLHLAGPSVSLTVIIATLAASITPCVMACIMLIFDAIFFYFTFLYLLLTASCESAFFSISVSLSLPYVNILSVLTLCGVIAIEGIKYPQLLLTMLFICVSNVTKII